MRRFIVRAHKAPVQPDRFLRAVGGEGHVEYLAQVLVNVLLISKGHREDSSLVLVLEDSQDFSRAISFEGAKLGSLPGWHETALLELIAEVLESGSRLAKEAEVNPVPGITVAARSFEQVVRQCGGSHYLLERKGAPLREVAIGEDPVFIMTDHIPFPRKTVSYLKRLGAEPISLGPRMLQASQCVTVLHNELDLR